MKTTPTQRNFKTNMKNAIKDINKNSQEKIYSYIEEKYISSYYESSENGFNRIKKLNTWKYSFMFIVIFLGLVLYIAAPYSKITAIPVTIMISSIVLIIFGMIHPSLAFMDGKSRIRVIIVYSLLFIMAFIFAGFTLQ